MSSNVFCLVKHDTHYKKCKTIPESIINFDLRYDLIKIFYEEINDEIRRLFKKDGCHQYFLNLILKTRKG